MGFRKMLKGAKQVPGMLKALKDMKKEGGMALCEACLKRQIEKTTSDVDTAFDDSIKSGYYKEAINKKCFVCNVDAKYMVSLKDAMSGVRAHKK